MSATTKTDKPAAKTYEEGVAAALARVEGIMSLDEAKGREGLAKVLAFDPSVSVDSAKTFLAASPKAEAASAAATSEEAAEASDPAKGGADALATAFTEAMKQSAPNVGPSVDTETKTGAEAEAKAYFGI